MKAKLEDSLNRSGNDEVVQEVRLIREKYAARFDYDLRRMVTDLKTKEAQHPERQADLAPLPPAGSE